MQGASVGVLGADFRGVCLVVVLTHDFLKLHDHRFPHGLHDFCGIPSIRRQFIEFLDLGCAAWRFDLPNHLHSQEFAQSSSYRSGIYSAVIDQLRG